MRHPFATVAGIAAVQHGRVTVFQLREAGVDKQRTKRWLAEGRLHRVHHGVYAIGHVAPSMLGDYMAAVLACGAGAILSHLPAAQLLRLVSGKPPPAEVTVPTLAGRRRPNIRIHRVRDLDHSDTATVNNIPIATVPRVLLDLAPRLARPDLVRACHEAWIHHRVTPAAIEACIARNPSKHGAGKLRLALGADVTSSALEDAFLALLREHRLPAPRTNVVHQGDRVDCRWSEVGLTVEPLSYRFHGSRYAFEADVARRRRSGHLAFTYGDVFERGAQTVAELAAALTRDSGRVARVSRSDTLTP